MEKSKFLKLNVQDLTKGLVVAVLVAVLRVLLTFLEQKGLSLTGVDWQSVGSVALTAALAYVSKNLFTDDKDRLLGKI